MRRISLLLMSVLLAAAAVAGSVLPCTVAGSMGVTVAKGVLPQSRQVEDLPRVGHWVHGRSRGGDALFFKAEDTAHEAWLLLRRDILRTAGDEGNTPAAGTDVDSGNKDGGDGQNGAVGDGRAVKGFFTRSSARARRAAVEEALGPNSTLSADDKVAAVVGQVEALADALMAVSLEMATTGIAGDLYVPLAERCYNAPHRSSKQEEKDKPLPSLLATGKGAAPSRLPSPFVGNAHVIKVAGKEVSRLQLALAAVAEAYEEETGNTVGVQHARAEEQLHAIRAVLQSSTRALENIFTVSKPLYLDGIEAASHEQLVLRKRIVENDESTEVLRKEMRQLVRARNRLQAWEQELRTGLRFTRRAASLEQLDTKELSTETMAVLGLALLASLRLGCTGELPGLEALPAPSLLTGLTGLRGGDFELDKRPLHRVVLFFSFTALVVREMKVWMLDGALRSAPLRASGARTLRYRVHRRLFQLFSLLLTLLPVFWVVGEVARVHLRGEVRLGALLAFLSPQQKVGIVLFLLAVTATARVLVMVLCLLPSFLDDPARMRRKKTA